jgi:hypothetical protein
MFVQLHTTFGAAVLAMMTSALFVAASVAPGAIV